MQVSLEQLQAHIDKVPANSYLGLQILEIGEGSCRVRMPYNPAFTNSWQHTHGGALMTLSDIAGWIAMATQNGLDNPAGVATLELKTNFLRSNRESDLFATARTIKSGYRLFFGDISIFDREDQIICHSTVTYIKTGSG